MPPRLKPSQPPKLKLKPNSLPKEKLSNKQLMKTPPQTKKRDLPDSSKRRSELL